MMLTYSSAYSTLGWVLAAFDITNYLVKVSIDSSIIELTKDLKTSFPTDYLCEDKDKKLFKFQFENLLECIKDPKKQYIWSVFLLGTRFQNTVWDFVRTIPPGQTRTYSEVARKIGNPNAVRAVANACAANNLAVVVPCHRVVRSDGQPSGYRWGMDRRKKLLEREKHEQA